MTIAGLDVGKRRIGIAICESAEDVRPVVTLERRSLQHDLDALRRELGERSVARIVIGLPLNMDGSEGPAARRMRAFAARVADALAIPVELCDERLTSFEARERLRDLPIPPARRKPAVDAVAAMLILEHWLAQNRSAGA